MATPVEYYQRYLNLSVPDPNNGSDIAVNISVSKYLLGLHESQKNARVALLRKIKKDLEAGKEADAGYKIRVAANTENGREVAEFSSINTRQENDPLFMLIRYPFAGKGSPEGIQAALQLAATDGPGESAIVSPANLQGYCDDLLGVDCSGFVGSFIRHEVQGAPWSDLTPSADLVSPNELISSIWSKAPGTVRNSAAEVDANDTNLLVLVDSAGQIIPGGRPPHGHIMISQPGELNTTIWDKPTLGVEAGTEVPAICVTESTGAKKSWDGTNGLAKSWYHYVDDPRLKNKGVILVERGVNGSTMRVKIKALL